MTDATAGGSKVEHVAEHALLKLVARLVMVVGVPAGLAFGGWMAANVVKATDENTKAVIETKGDVKALFGTLNSRIDAHADRLKGLDDRNIQQDARMDRQDGKIDTIWQRVWTLPGVSKQ